METHRRHFRFGLSTHLYSGIDDEDDEFQAPLLVPLQPLIPSGQQPRLCPCLFYSNRDQMRWNIRPPAGDGIFVLLLAMEYSSSNWRWNIRPPALPAIISNLGRQVVCTPKGQTTETEIELWELFLDNAMLESITDFTNIKIGLLHYFNVMAAQKNICHRNTCAVRPPLYGWYYACVSYEYR